MVLRSFFSFAMTAMLTLLSASAGAQLSKSVEVTLSGGQKVTITKQDVASILLKFGNEKALAENPRPIIGGDGSVRMVDPQLNGRPIFYGGFGGNSQRADLFCKVLGFSHSTDSFKGKSYDCYGGDMSDLTTDKNGQPVIKVTNQDIDGGFVCNFFGSITCKP